LPALTWSSFANPLRPMASVDQVVADQEEVVRAVVGQAVAVDLEAAEVVRAAAGALQAEEASEEEEASVAAVEVVEEAAAALATSGI
jgi:hypothetical protein